LRTCRPGGCDRSRPGPRTSNVTRDARGSRNHRHRRWPGTHPVTSGAVLRSRPVIPNPRELEASTGVSCEMRNACVTGWFAPHGVDASERSDRLPCRIARGDRWSWRLGAANIRADTSALAKTALARRDGPDAHVSIGLFFPARHIVCWLPCESVRQSSRVACCCRTAPSTNAGARRR
jgi:hypothetical protein